MAILELVLLGLARWLRIDWLFWDSDGSAAANTGHEQRQRQHNRQWARDFLEEKRLERERLRATREARASQSVGQPPLGRPGSRRTL